MLEMNPGIRAQWTAALRSGKYEQGTASLRSGNKFCCLGVLCDLAVKAGVLTGEPGEAGCAWYYHGAIDYLPEAVTEWAGLQDINQLAGDPGATEPLAVLNDDFAWDFAQIADVIDGGASS